MFRQGDPEKERSDMIREIVTIDEDLCNGWGSRERIWRRHSAGRSG